MAENRARHRDEIQGKVRKWTATEERLLAIRRSLSHLQAVEACLHNAQEQKRLAERIVSWLLEQELSSQQRAPVKRRKKAK